MAGASVPPPTPEDRRWVAAVVGGRPRGIRVRRLTGGISSAVHRVDVLGGGGGGAGGGAGASEVRRFVLRRWVGDHPDDLPGAVRREVAVLTRLEAAGLPAPRLVAADPEPRCCSAPAVLMTQLPGRLVLRPADPDDWLRQIAEALPRIHAAPVDAPPFESWLDPEHLRVPAWSSDDGMWRAALDLVAGPPPAGPTTFIHRDYQPFNLLWTGPRLSGVVDWVWASRGSPDVDVAHCRLNLTALYSADDAARFLARYEAVAGRRVEPWWDVAGLLLYLPGWGSFLPRHAGSRLTVDIAGMHRRVEATLRAALARAGP